MVQVPPPQPETPRTLSEGFIFFSCLSICSCKTGDGFCLHVLRYQIPRRKTVPCLSVFNILYRVGENGYVADVIVGTRKNGSAVLYDLVNIYEKITEVPVTMVSNENSQRRLETSVKNNVTNPTENVKQKQFEIINEINPAPNKKDRGRSPVFLGKMALLTQFIM